MKTEEALALLLARLSFDKLTKTRIFHLIKNHVDWYEFLNICVKKKLICLVYKKLEDLNLIQLLPMMIINNMQYHYEQNQKQNERFMQASDPIISFFRQNNILSTPVKGLRFLNTLYSEEPGVRILNDIDFIASAKDQEKIHNYMINSEFKPYLVNNQDILCCDDEKIRSYFYINFNETSSFGKLRIDFDFSFTDKWIKLIQLGECPIYEFLYLCQTYYTESAAKTKIDDISTYDYIKLVDLREYHCRYLSLFSPEDILVYANKLGVQKALLFTGACLSNIYTDFSDWIYFKE